MFEEFQDQEYFKTITSRLDAVELAWVKQARDILSEFEDIETVNDIGCNVGQLYQSLKSIDTIKYRGYDFEKRYLDYAKAYFNQSEKVFIYHDIEKSKPPAADCSVCSATLEHLQRPLSGLMNILESTNRLVVLRTFVGHQPNSNLFYKKGANLPYPINQFSFKELGEAFEQSGFSIDFRTDTFTSSLPKYIGCGVVRSFYFVVGRKYE